MITFSERPSIERCHRGTIHVRKLLLYYDRIARADGPRQPAGVETRDRKLMASTGPL